MTVINIIILITRASAKEGVSITNNSRFEPMVFMKHFGPNNPDVPMELIN